MVRKRRKKALAVLTSIVMAAGTILAVPSIPAEAASAGRMPMYRLYNPNSGEHFYTKTSSERDNLKRVGWKDEGEGWTAPETSNTPVYRLYNPNAGEHHYTTAMTERNNLISVGWNDEGIGWYSDDAKSVPVYREYNPNATTGTHNYTTSKSEHDNLVSLGWKDEGIGWYGITEKKDDPVDEPEDPKDPEEPTEPIEPTEPENPTDPEDSLKIGDTVILGTYEQDNDFTNGPEPIEWQVIGTRDGHTLLLSKYVLGFQKYNVSPAELMTWEECSLRSWLNSYFYLTAFSYSDKERIVTAHNENPDTYELYKSETFPYSGAEGGNATDDKVFLLSWTEARDYLDGKLNDSDLGADNYNPKLLCKPTSYADQYETRAYANKDNYFPADTVGCCKWWLRSPGRSVYGDSAMLVSFTGSLGSESVNFDSEGVRPALLIGDGQNDSPTEPEAPTEPEDPKEPKGGLKIGDTVIIGKYEQDNDLSNGAEPIEWDVIGTRDGHTLLLSKYALDCKQYNWKFTDITWENSTLRFWLNHDFYNTAFSDSDKKRIVTAHNENPDSYELFTEEGDIYLTGAEGGSATGDKVFLLSWTEARDYFDGKLYDSYLGGEIDNQNQKLFCKATNYAKAQGLVTRSSIYNHDLSGRCGWWLRSPGYDQRHATCVYYYGALYSDNVDNYKDEGVRPALLID